MADLEKETDLVRTMRQGLFWHYVRAETHLKGPSIASAEIRRCGESRRAKKVTQTLGQRSATPIGLRLAILVALELDTLVVLMLRHLCAALFLNGTHVGYSLR